LRLVFSVWVLKFVNCQLIGNDHATESDSGQALPSSGDIAQLHITISHDNITADDIRTMVDAVVATLANNASNDMVDGHASDDSAPNYTVEEERPVISDNVTEELTLQNVDHGIIDVVSSSTDSESSNQPTDVPIVSNTEKPTPNKTATAGSTTKINHDGAKSTEPPSVIVLESLEEKQTTSFGTMVIAVIVIATCVGYIIAFIVGVIVVEARKHKAKTAASDAARPRLELQEGASGYHNPTFEMP